MAYTRPLLRVVQPVPVRIHQTENHLVLAAPLPGLEPPDISVTIEPDQVILRGSERGPGQHEREVLIDEWAVGPYYRDIALPQPVNGALANATYGNGVLVLSLPKLKKGQRRTHTTFQLEPLVATRGRHIGHTGSAMRPVRTRTLQPQEAARKSRGQGRTRKTAQARRRA